jgi:hypothetical protein
MGAGKKIAIGCGVLVLAFAVFIGAIIGFVWWATAGPEEAVQNFLAAAAAGDIEKAHDYFSAPLKDEQPLEEFRKAVAASPSLFAVADASFSNRSIDGTTAKLSGSVTLKAGTTLPASFELVQEGDDWKLIAYHLGPER